MENQIPNSHRKSSLNPSRYSFTWSAAPITDIKRTFDIFPAEVDDFKLYSFISQQRKIWMCHRTLKWLIGTITQMGLLGVDGVRIFFFSPGWKISSMMEWNGPRLWWGYKRCIFARNIYICTHPALCEKILHIWLGLWGVKKSLQKMEKWWWLWGESGFPSNIALWQDEIASHLGWVGSYQVWRFGWMGSLGRIVRSQNENVFFTMGVEHENWSKWQ